MQYGDSRRLESNQIRWRLLTGIDDSQGPNPLTPANCGTVRREDAVGMALPLPHAKEDEELTVCAADGCTNSTVMQVEEGWLCLKCRRRAERREATHRRWQPPDSS